MNKKTSKIEFKLEEELFNSYKLLCERNGYDMSKRLRLFIEHEINNDKSDENIFNI
jgi:hypothetical protein